MSNAVAFAHLVSTLYLPAIMSFLCAWALRIMLPLLRDARVQAVLPTLIKAAAQLDMSNEDRYAFVARHLATRFKLDPAAVQVVIEAGVADFKKDFQGAFTPGKTLPNAAAVATPAPAIDPLALLAQGVALLQAQQAVAATPAVASSHDQAA